MKKIKNVIVFIIILILAIFIINKKSINTKIIIPTKQLYKYEANIEVNYTDEILFNPGKGLTSRNEIYDDKVYEVISTCYYRFNWSDIEKTEGVFDWNVIDEQMNNAINHNKKFAFGIMGSNVSCELEYVTPKWVFDKGAQYTTCLNESGNVTQIIPIWNDEIYIQEMKKLVKAVADRYDGNENIAFIDNRSYGSWGEQHPTHANEAFIEPEELKELYIKTYLENFKKTKICNPYGMVIYEDVYNWAISQGMSIRADFITDDGNYTRYGDVNFEYAIGKVPVMFEYLGDVYTKLINNQEINFNVLNQYINDWKPSFMHVYSEFYRKHPEYIKEIANKVGYYFKYTGGEYESNITNSENTTIKIDFLNDGVAPLFEPCTVCIGILDENDNLVKKIKTNIDAKQWMPNETKQENISISYSGIKNGQYKLAIGLFLNEEDNNPTYLIANDGRTEENWYKIGNITIKNIELSNIGDVDCDGNITAYDAYLTLKYSIEDDLEQKIIIVADIDKDNIVTSYDAYKILKKSIELMG